MVDVGWCFLRICPPTLFYFTIFFLFTTKMADKAFDIQLILDYSDTATDLPIMKWNKNVELVCELCNMKK